MYKILITVNYDSLRKVFIQLFVGPLATRASWWVKAILTTLFLMGNC